jgi:ribose transport system substrate-binding protein
MKKPSVWTVWILVLTLVASACAPATAPQQPSPTPQKAALPEICQGQDGMGRKVGFANLGESVPFAVQVREGIQKVAKDCNVELVVADNALDPQKALDNARNFVAQGVKGVIEFNVHGNISGAICDILKGLPVIAIDIAHPECAVFMGANNRMAGELGGEGAGKLAKSLWACQIDAIVTFEAPGVGQVNVDRMNGLIAGVKKVCPDLAYGNFEQWSPTVPNSIITRLDADRVDPGYKKGKDFLTANPQARHIVALCINDDSCLGFLSAVKELGREGQVIFASQGADPSVWPEIRKNPYYAGSTAYFPEKYGEILIPAIIRMMNGEKVQGPLYVKHVFISKDNIDQYYPEKK